MEHSSDTAAYTNSYSKRKNLFDTLDSSSRLSSTVNSGKYLPFGKRPFGCRPLPSLSRKPDHIYLIGRDSLELQKRKEILKEAGYSTVTITPEAAIQESRKPQITISIFCHSLTSLERVQLAASFRRYSPEARLLLVSQKADLNFEVMLFHSVVAMEDGPEALIEAIHRLAKTA